MNFCVIGSYNAGEGLNLILFLEGMRIDSPVLKFLPFLTFDSSIENRPNPLISTEF